MADNADRAADEYAVHEQARAAGRVKVAPVHRLGCDECDEPIPLARREALAGHDCLLCVDCQELLERKGGAR
jgi:RNA polymerase-binding transcription factor DksA